MTSLIWQAQPSWYILDILKSTSNYCAQITDLIADVKDTAFSTYSGSLTTPGCMEIVNWINFLQPIPISSAQLAKFRMLKDGSNEDIVDNFRPVQPLNGREVVFYGP